jgi:hypothetical protein
MLLACGESRINSVDDKVLEEAKADRADADLKQKQTALLGTWRTCVKTSDSASTRYEYAFTSDGQLSLVQLDYNNSSCVEDAVQSDSLRASWQLVPVKESPDFTLHFKWANGGKLESQYRLSAATSVELPKLFDLKDQSDLKLVELKDKDHFLTLEKIPADEIEELRKKSESMIIEYAKSLLRRNGSWQTACSDGTRSSLQFKVGKTISMTSTRGVYKEKDCETLKEEESERTSVNFTLVSVPDLTQKKIILDAGKVKGSMKVSFDKIDQLELSDLIEGKESLILYTYAAGVAP